MQSRTRVHDLQTCSHEAALAVFIKRKLEIDTMLQRLTAFSADHFGVDPDEVDWGHVGTLVTTPSCGARSVTVVFQEGEYAA